MTGHLSRRDFLGQTAALAATTATAALLPRALFAVEPPFKGAERPNVILLMSDDHAWQEVGYMTPGIITPNLDEIATKTGVQFTRYYAGHSRCSPSRACILTGRQALRTGVRAPGNFVNCKGMYRNEQTIAKLFQQAGYTTGHFGKWHVGEGEGYEPTDRGYDTAAWQGNHYNNNPGFAKGIKHNGDSSEATVACALQFIERARKQRRPFFTTIWFGSPHAPYEASKQHRKLYPNSPCPEYLAEITGIDVAIGQLREVLKKAGLRDNTQLWFCGDNGPVDKEGANGKKVRLCGPKGEIKPLISGKKVGSAEGGIRVPGVLEWPGMIRGNRKIDVPISGADFYATFAVMLGVEGKPVGRLDGEDVLPIILGKQKQRQRGLPFYIGSRWPGEKDRKGRPAAPRSALVEQRWKCRCDDGAWRLYDLESDPMESRDLSEQNAMVMARMRGELEAFHKSLIEDTTQKDTR